MTQPFTPEQFTATPHASDQDKADFANALAAFIEADCPFEKFSPWLYTKLHMHLYGHIAEMARGRFYDVWFSTYEKCFHWLQWASRGGMHETPMGDPHHCWVDVEIAFSRWIRDSGQLKRYQTLFEQEVEVAERRELARLQQKYGKETI